MRLSSRSPKDGEPLSAADMRRDFAQHARLICEQAPLSQFSAVAAEDADSSASYDEHLQSKPFTTLRSHLSEYGGKEQCLDRARVSMKARSWTDASPNAQLTDTQVSLADCNRLMIAMFRFVEFLFLLHLLRLPFRSQHPSEATLCSQR